MRTPLRPIMLQSDGKIATPGLAPLSSAIALSVLNTPHDHLLNILAAPKTYSRSLLKLNSHLQLLAPRLHRARQQITTLFLQALQVRLHWYAQTFREKKGVKRISEQGEGLSEVPFLQHWLTQRLTNQGISSLEMTSRALPFSSEWIQEELARILSEKQAEKHYSVSAPTMTRWRKGHFLPAPLKGLPSSQDIHQLAALFITAIIDPRIQGFVPPFQSEEEQHSWCYAELPPDGGGTPSVVQAVPYPIPSSLLQFYPANTIYYSPMQYFDPLWHSIGEYGALRFGAAEVSESGTIQWKLSLKDLAAWEPQLADHAHLMIYGYGDIGSTYHEEATAILEQLAIKRILNAPLTLS